MGRGPLVVLRKGIIAVRRERQCVRARLPVIQGILRPIATIARLVAVLRVSRSVRVDIVFVVSTRLPRATTEGGLASMGWKSAWVVIRTRRLRVHGFPRYDFVVWKF